MSIVFELALASLAILFAEFLSVLCTEMFSPRFSLYSLAFYWKPPFLFCLFSPFLCLSYGKSESSCCSCCWLMDWLILVGVLDIAANDDFVSAGWHRTAEYTLTLHVDCSSSESISPPALCRPLNKAETSFSHPSRFLQRVADKKKRKNKFRGQANANKRLCNIALMRLSTEAWFFLARCPRKSQTDRKSKKKSGRSQLISIKQTTK